jgi:hypothetical protein
MHRWLIILALLATLSLISFACSWTTEQTSKGLAIRCPKCGAFYSSKEGAETFEWMRGGPRDTRR